MPRIKETRRNADKRRRLEGTGDLRSGSDNERLESFRCWTGQLDPKWLVDAGFSYTGEADAVRCFSCNVVIHNWTKDMDPLLVHIARAPNCRHLLRLIPVDLFAEIKDQIFDNKKMRVPFEGDIKWPCNNFTGEIVEEHDSFHGQPHHPSAGQNEHQPHHPSAGQNEHHPGHGESNTETMQSDVSEGHEVIGRMDIQEGGADVYRDVQLPVENVTIRGELNAEILAANGDVDMDDVLNSVAAQSVLQTGYGTEDQVKSAIIDLRRNGKQIFNGSDILETILETERQVRQN